MNVLVKSPAGALSFIPEFNMESVMLVRHYDTIANGSPDDAEALVMGVLHDLVDGDAYAMSIREMYYAFLQVKIASFGSEAGAVVTCPNNLPDGSPCGNRINVRVDFADVDVTNAPADVKPQEVDCRFKCLGSGDPGEFVVRPPQMRDELDLIAEFKERGLSRADLYDSEGHKDVADEYLRMRQLAYLCLKSTGKPFMDRGIRRAVYDEVSGGDVPVTFLKDLVARIAEADRFGVWGKPHRVPCPRCGGAVTFWPGILSGVML